MAAVGSTVKVLRALFEVEREIVRCLTTFIYRVGDIELKYLLCQHVWESAGKAGVIGYEGTSWAVSGRTKRPERKLDAYLKSLFVLMKRSKDWPLSTGLSKESF